MKYIWIFLFLIFTLVYGKESPEAAAAYSNASASFKEKNYEEAYNGFKKALRIEEDNVQYMFGSAISAFYLDKLSSSRKYCEGIIAGSEQDNKYHKKAQDLLARISAKEEQAVGRAMEKAKDGPQQNILLSEISYSGVTESFSSSINAAVKGAIEQSSYDEVGRETEGLTAKNYEKFIKKNNIKNTRLMLAVSCSFAGETMSISISVINVESGAALYSGSTRMQSDDLDRLQDRLLALLVESYDAVSDLESGSGQAGAITAAVLDLDPRNCPKMEAVIITDLLREKLIRQGKFTIINRANMKAILEEQSFQASGCTSEECKVQLGQLLNASRVISGELSKIKGEYIMTVKMLDVESGKFINMAKCNIKDISDASKPVEEAAAELSESFSDRLHALDLKRKKSLRGVILNGSGVLLSAGGMVLFHVLGRNGTTEAEGIYSSYLSSTVSSEADEHGASLDSTVKRSDMMYNLRDTFFTALYLTAVYEVVAIVRHVRMTRRYRAKESLNLSLRLNPDQAGLTLSREF